MLMYDSHDLQRKGHAPTQAHRRHPLRSHHRIRGAESCDRRQDRRDPAHAGRRQARTSRLVRGPEASKEAQCGSKAEDGPGAESEVGKDQASLRAETNHYGDQETEAHDERRWSEAHCCGAKEEMGGDQEGGSAVDTRPDKAAVTATAVGVDLHDRFERNQPFTLGPLSQLSNYAPPKG